MMANQDLSIQAADILVVDDTIDNLRMLTDILIKAAYKPRPVEDPQVALEAALAQPPSLILLDVRMPQMSGFEVCRRLKQDERTRDVPVIFISALEDTEDRVQGFEVGAVDFVSKPVQEAEVLARVKTHLQLRHTQLHLEELVAERTAELEKLVAERSAALDRAEDQIRILFESAQVGIGLTTLEGEVLSANQALLGMTGYTEAEFQQLNVRDLYLEPVKRAVLLEQLQEAEVVQEFGIQILRKDGTSFYASLNVSKLARTDEDRDVLLAMIENVTEQVRAEATLQESEQRFRALYQNLPLPAAIWRRTGEDFEFSYANEEMDALTSGTIGNYMGLLLTDVHRGRPDIIEDIRRCFAEKRTILRSTEFAYSVSGRRSLLTRYSFVPPDMVLVVTEDITERKRAEEALRASEEQYRDLVEKISDVIYTVDAGGTITYLNPAVQSLIGRPAEELVGQSFAQFIHPEDVGLLQDNIQNLLSGGDPGPSEYRVKDSADETRWIRVASQPVEAGGEVVGLQGVLTDITQRKKAEEQLEQSAAQTERDRLARDLHDAVTQTLFAASLLADTMPRIWERDRAMARQNLTQLGRLVRGALAEMRSLLFELRPDAMRDQSLGQLLRPLVGAAGARARATADLSIQGDRVLPENVSMALHRIAQESLNNVAKHAEATTVNVDLDGSPERVVLRITDDGRGFDPAQIPPGHMGISIMKERAQEIGAIFELQSQRGHGTQVVATWSDQGEGNVDD